MKSRGRGRKRSEATGGKRRRVERRHASGKRRRDDRLFETLARYAPVGIFMNDAHGRCIYVNPPWCEFMGRSLAELIELGDQLIHPQDRARVLAAWQTAVEKRSSFEFEYRLLRADGSAVWVRANAAVIPAWGEARFIGTLLDITSAKLAQLKLVESQQRMQAVMNASPVAIVSLDPSGRIQDLNKSAERMFGWTAGDAVEAWRIVPDIGLADFQETMSRVAGGGRVIDKLELRRRRNGELFIASVSAAPLVDAAGRPAGMVMVMSDITEHERILGELNVLADASQQLLQNLHDSCIQSLFAIGVNLESSRMHAAGNAGELVGAIDEALNSLNLVIQELRGFISGSTEAGVVHLREGIERAARGAGREGPQFTIDIAPDVVEVLSREQLQQMLQISREGISNIIRHAGASTAAVSLRRHAGEIELEIRDDGVGFDPHAKDHNGRGLNSIAARVRKLGGHWRVDSGHARGTRLVVGVSA